MSKPVLFFFAFAIFDSILEINSSLLPLVVKPRFLAKTFKSLTVILFNCSILVEDILLFSSSTNSSPKSLILSKSLFVRLRESGLVDSLLVTTGSKSISSGLESRF